MRGAISRRGTGTEADSDFCVVSGVFAAFCVSSGRGEFLGVLDDSVEDTASSFGSAFALMGGFAVMAARASGLLWADFAEV